jgi:hypothetical protein
VRLVRSASETFLEQANNQEDGKKRIQAKDYNILVCHVAGTSRYSGVSCHGYLMVLGCATSQVPEGILVCHVTGTSRYSGVSCHRYLSSL